MRHEAPIHGVVYCADDRPIHQVRSCSSRGALTCTMVYAAIAPQAMLQSTFGETRRRAARRPRGPQLGRADLPGRRDVGLRRLQPRRPAVGAPRRRGEQGRVHRAGRSSNGDRYLQTQAGILDCGRFRDGRPLSASISARKPRFAGDQARGPLQAAGRRRINHGYGTRVVTVGMAVRLCRRGAGRGAGTRHQTLRADDPDRRDRRHLLLQVEGRRRRHRRGARRLREDLHPAKGWRRRHPHRRRRPLQDLGHRRAEQVREGAAVSSVRRWRSPAPKSRSRTTTTFVRSICRRSSARQVGHR